MINWYEVREMQDELMATGDARRCPIHPNERTSTADGMFDMCCNACEGEMSEWAAKWDIDPTNPRRSQCGGFRYIPRGENVRIEGIDEIPFDSLRVGTLRRPNAEVFKVTTKRIEVKVGDSSESIALTCSWPGMTIAEAKRRARYMRSAEYAKGAEMSEPFHFAGVFVDGQLTWEPR